MSNPISEMKKFIEAIFPLYRSICSTGLDEALERIKSQFIPDLTIEKYPTSSAAWTWTLPQKWELTEGFIQENGKTIIHTDNEPLCVWSGSLPVDKVVSYEELKKHVYTEPDRPDLLCWYFKYYGNLDWGFNLPHNLFKTLDKNAHYTVKIRSRYYEDDFRIGHVTLKGKSDKTILITSDICHPFQCNDSLSGAAVAYQLYQYLKNHNRHYTYLFTFVPETIGTIAFLANNEQLLPRILYHIYTEFWGRDSRVSLQKSLNGNTAIDRIATEVVRERFGSECRVLNFREDGIMNDELVTSMPNIHIPSIALVRKMFYEYHSHRDTPQNLNYEKIEEGFEIVKEIIDRLEEEKEMPERDHGSIDLREGGGSATKETLDFIPQPLFKGPIFLSKYGLWVDWRVEPDLNAAIDLIIACMDGRNSVADISRFAKLPFEKVLNYINKFEQAGLVKRSSCDKDKQAHEVGKY